MRLTKSVSRGGKENKLTSKYSVLPDDIVLKRKMLATKPVNLSLQGKPIFTPSNIEDLGFPIRPTWNGNMAASKVELEAAEEISFKSWLDGIYERYKTESEKMYDELPAFEHNLQVWKQLWHVVEKSSIISFVIDVRNPLLFLPESLIQYLKENFKEKQPVIILTKCDMVSSEIVSQWKSYLTKRFQVACFTFCSKKTNFSSFDKTKGVRSRRKQLKKPVTNKDREVLRKESEALLKSLKDLKPEIPIPFIGFIGFPNVGKSSLLNSLMGKKVVSVSKSCGHTKHWQTHYIKDRSETDVAVLCDSPGLVFPRIFMKMFSRNIYELCGVFPIAQIREPFSAIRILLERLDLLRLYNVKRSELDCEREDSFTCYEFLATMADKKGYYISKKSDPDLHRVGLEILKDCVDGVVLFSFLPPK